MLLLILFVFPTIGQDLINTVSTLECRETSQEPDSCQLN